MENGNGVSDFKKKIEENIGMSKVVKITFPIEVFRRMDEGAKKDATDCYWLYIKQLMDHKDDGEKGDLTTAMLMQRDDELSERITKIEKLLNKEEQEKKVTKHFGNEKGE